MLNPKYKKPKIDNGDLRTQVEFYEVVANGSYPNQTEVSKLYECLALAYNPSQKDREILNVNQTREGLTLKIRDPLKAYTPLNTHQVKIHDYRYDAKKTWEIVDVAYDFEDNTFIKIVLAVSS